MIIDGIRNSIYLNYGIERETKIGKLVNMASDVHKSLEFSRLPYICLKGLCHVILGC